MNAARLLAALRGAIDLHNRGRLDEADAVYRDVLRRAPRHADALHLRALVAHAKGRYADACRFADAAVAEAPAVANFHNTAGDAWRRAGNPGKARARLAAALRLDPSMAMAHHNLSVLAGEEGRDDEAREHNRRALELAPEHAEALAYGLELACARQDWAHATQLAARVERVPDAAARTALATYHCHRARAHFAALEFAAGDQAAAAATALDPQLWAGWALRGEAAYERDAFADAEWCCTIAANLAPGNPDARRNLALLLRNVRRLDDAASHFAAWLDDHPDDAQAQFNLGTIELMQGNYADGWGRYEARWRMAAHGHADFVGAPRWNGGPAGRLLLHAEQGLGDAVQMLRFVPEAVRRCKGAVVLQVPGPLLRIVRRVFASGQVSVVSEIPDLRYDAACPLMSLPLALGANARERIAAAGAYLTAPLERVAEFSARLAAHPGRKLGLVWQGSAGSAINRRRAIPEAALVPLLAQDGWTPVSLQFGVRDPRIASRPLVDLGAMIADFEDLAAAMTTVDAIVCVDTGPAHLAGALGLPVHVLVPWLHDWRWGVDGPRCDWYPSVELVRQRVGGDWTEPVARIAAALGDRPHARAVAAVDETLGARPRPIVDNRHPLPRVACRHGVFTLPLFDRYVTRSLLAYGEYSPREAEVLASYLRPGDTAVDVGANVGALTLPMARAVGPSGRIVALEPQSLLHRCLASTIADSGVAWVEARRAAAGAMAGTARIARRSLSTAGNFGGVALAPEGDGEPVEVVALDDLGLAACRLVKVDVEGRELDVLRGAARTIASCRPVLVVESDRSGTRGPLSAFMRRLGYRVFVHQPPLYDKRNFRNTAVDLFPGIVSGNLVGLPPSIEPTFDMHAASA